MIQKLKKKRTAWLEEIKMINFGGVGGIFEVEFHRPLHQIARLGDGGEMEDRGRIGDHKVVECRVGAYVDRSLVALGWNVLACREKRGGRRGEVEGGKCMEGGSEEEGGRKDLPTSAKPLSLVLKTTS
jgi:hypothetical protein